MTFPSNPCYLPIYEGGPEYSLKRYNKAWRSFIMDGKGELSNMDRIKEWNGTLINDVIVFETEQDKMWFILCWS